MKPGLLARLRHAMHVLTKGDTRFEPETSRAADWFNAWHSQHAPSNTELLRQYKAMAYACSQINAMAFASVPVKLYVQTRKGEKKALCATRAVPRDQALWLHSQAHIDKRIRSAVAIEEVEDHPLLDLLDTVNDYLDAFNLYELTSLYQDFNGSAYWWIERNGAGVLNGVPKAIWILPAHLVTVQKSKTDIISGYKYGEGPSARVYPPDEVIHFKIPSLLDPYRDGMPPARAAWHAISLTDKQYAYESHHMDNRARPDAIVSPKTEDASFSGDAAARFEERINQKFRKGGAGGIAVLENALHYEPVAFPAKDLEMLAFHRVAKEEIANIFGVPLPMLSTETNLANLQAARTLHARNTLWPRCQRFDQVINQRLIPLYDTSGRLFVAHDNPVPEDVEQQSRVHGVYLDKGVISINEVRAELGKAPEPWGDKPWLPFTLSQVDSEVPTAPPLSPDERAVTKGGHRRRLPDGRAIKSFLQGVLRQQRQAVLSALGAKVASIGKDFQRVDLSAWTEEMARRAAPLVEVEVNNGGRDVLARLGVSPEESIWNVQLPEVQAAINEHAYRFCEATNETTAKEINVAVDELRRELAEGMVEAENTVRELTRRVSAVFENAEKFRARRIAVTEASRGVHTGQYMAAKDSNLVVGFKWLCSADACALCQSVAAEHPDGIPLDGEFAHDEYTGAVRYPPLHPNCQCTITELLRKER
jgi:HK97 family phage portal protein